MEGWGLECEGQNKAINEEQGGEGVGGGEVFGQSIRGERSPSAGKME